MTQGERVKEIRTALSLTLEKFGENLGVGKTAISKIEKNERSLTDQMAKSICREYNVNENWLRTGEGDMFIKMTRNNEISQFVGQLMTTEDDSFKKRLISALAALDENGWDILEQFLDSIQKKEG